MSKFLEKSAGNFKKSNFTLRLSADKSRFSTFYADARLGDDKSCCQACCQACRIPSSIPLSMPHTVRKECLAVNRVISKIPSFREGVIRRPAPTGVSAGKFRYLPTFMNRCALMSAGRRARYTRLATMTETTALMPDAAMFQLRVISAAGLPRMRSLYT